MAIQLRVFRYLDIHRRTTASTLTMCKGSQSNQDRWDLNPQDITDKILPGSYTTVLVRLLVRCIGSSNTTLAIIYYSMRSQQVSLCGCVYGKISNKSDTGNSWMCRWKSNPPHIYLRQWGQSLSTRLLPTRLAVLWRFFWLYRQKTTVNKTTAFLS